MRLIRITTNPSVYLNQFYDIHPGLRNAPYRVQYRNLMADCFGWADFWTYAFGKLGYDVWELVGNAEPMQKTWAKEHGITYGEETWLHDIITAQVKNFQPDIVFVNDYLTYTLEFFQHLRSECPSIRFVIGWCAGPHSDMRIFNAYDLVLSSIPEYVEKFREEGHWTKLMRHAFEPRILEKISSERKDSIDFSFLGSIIKAPEFHYEREKLLKRLIEKTNLQLWSGFARPSVQEIQDFAFNVRVFKAGSAIRKLPAGNVLGKCISKLTYHLGQRGFVQKRASFADLIARIGYYSATTVPPSLNCYVDETIMNRARPPLFGLSMYQTLSASKITLNTHGDNSILTASNMRLYEATGIGTCLLTEMQQNLSSIFEPDVEVVTYQNAEEAIEKVKYLLEHEDERKKIAAAGQRRTLKDHTFALRAQQLNDLILASI